MGVGRIKTKEQNVQGGKRPNNTKVSGGVQQGRGVQAKRMVERS